MVPCISKLNVNQKSKSGVSNIMDYLLAQNYMQLGERIFILCNFAGLIIIGKTSISQNYIKNSQNFYIVVSQNFVMITYNK